MCRWNAYIGHPLLLDELLFQTEHGLIDQSLHSRMGAETTNGDGFGLGWYVAGMEDAPGRYRSVEPAWNDANLRDLAGTSSRLFSSRTSGRRSAAPCSRPTVTIPARALALRAQRPLERLPRDAQRPGARDRAVALQRDRRLDRLRVALLPRFDFRARGRPDPGGRTGGGVCRGGRRTARHRESRADDPGLQRRPAALGRALLDRAQLAQPVRLRGRERASEASPRRPAAAAVERRDRAIVSEPLGDLPGAWLEVPESTALVIEAGASSSCPSVQRRPSRGSERVAMTQGGQQMGNPRPGNSHKSALVENPEMGGLEHVGFE